MSSAEHSGSSVSPLSRVGNARGRATRQRLLDAAFVCFGDLGYVKVRVADVTTMANVSHGAFYRHFRDKDHLLLEALSLPLEALLQATPHAGDPHGDEPSIIAATTRFFAVYAEYRGLLRVLREIAATHDPDLAKLWLDVRGRYVASVQAWLDHLDLDAGLGAQQELGLLAEALGAVLEQLAYTHLGLAGSEPGPEEIEALGRVAGHVWARSLGR